MKNSVLLILITLTLFSFTNSSNPLSEKDFSKFFKILKQPKKTLKDVHYSLASAYKLGENPEDLGISSKLCSLVDEALKEKKLKESTPKDLYHLIASAIGLKCKNVDFEKINEMLKTNLGNLSGPVSGNLDKIFFTTRSLFLLRRKVRKLVSAKILKEKIFENVMKIYEPATGKFCASGDCFSNTGKVYTILQNLNSLLLRQDALSTSILARYVKISSRIDQVVGMFFKQKNVELATLSYFSSGINQLSSVVPLSKKISKMYITILRNLFLAKGMKRSVKTITDLYELTEGLNSIIKSNIHSSFFVSPFKVDVAKNQISVTVQTVYGKPVQNVKSVQLQKVYSVTNEEESLLEDLEFTQSGIHYTLDYSEDAENIGSGSIKFVFEILPKKKSEAFTSIVSSKIIKFISDVEIKDFKVLVHKLNSRYESVGRRSYKLGSTEEKLSRPLDMDTRKGLGLSFKLKNSKNASLYPHQVFLQLTHRKTDKNFVFVVKPRGNSYIFMIKFGKVADTLFKNLQGDYSLRLIVADESLTNKIYWNFGQIHLSFGLDRDSTIVSTIKPEIRHVFRLPEKEPSSTVSMVFFALIVLVPFSILVFGLASLKPNFGLCPSGIGFILNVILHLNIALAMCIIALYWVKITIFQAFKCFLVLGGFYFTLGSLALRKTYESRTLKE